MVPPRALVSTTTRRIQHLVARAGGRVALRRGDEQRLAEREPEVCVVITARDRPALLSLAIQSVRAQHDVRLECVVVDDGSVDAGVLATARRAAARDGRVRVVRHSRPFGLAAARNSGLAMATAPFVCFLDDDDHLCHGSLTGRLAVLRTADDDVVGAYCDWVTVEAGDELDWYVPVRRGARRADVDLLGTPWGTAFIATAPMLRREAVLAAGGFNEALDRAEDAELWVRLLRSGYRFVYVGKVGVAYRQSPDSMVGSAPQPQLDRLLSVGEWLETRVPIDELGPGPCRESWPLSELKMRAEQLPSILRYLALIACTDMDAATAEGRTLLPASLRLPARIEAHRADMVRTSVRRGGKTEDVATAVVAELLERVAKSDSPAPTVVRDARLARPIGTHPGRLTDLLPDAGSTDVVAGSVLHPR